MKIYYTPEYKFTFKPIKVGYYGNIIEKGNIYRFLCFTILIKERGNRNE